MTQSPAVWFVWHREHRLTMKAKGSNEKNKIIHANNDIKAAKV